LCINYISFQSKTQKKYQIYFFQFVAKQAQLPHQIRNTKMTQQEYQQDVINTPQPKKIHQNQSQTPAMLSPNSAQNASMTSSQCEFETKDQVHNLPCVATPTFAPITDNQLSKFSSTQIRSLGLNLLTPASAGSNQARGASALAGRRNLGVKAAPGSALTASSIRPDFLAFERLSSIEKKKRTPQPLPHALQHKQQQLCRSIQHKSQTLNKIINAGSNVNTTPITHKSSSHAIQSSSPLLLDCVPGSSAAAGIVSEFLAPQPRLNHSQIMPATPVKSSMSRLTMSGSSSVPSIPPMPATPYSHTQPMRRSNLAQVPLLLLQTPAKSMTTQRNNNTSHMKLQQSQQSIEWQQQTPVPQHLKSMTNSAVSFTARKELRTAGQCDAPDSEHATGVKRFSLASTVTGTPASFMHQQSKNRYSMTPISLNQASSHQQQYHQHRSPNQLKGKENDPPPSATRHTQSQNEISTAPLIVTQQQHHRHQFEIQQKQQSQRSDQTSSRFADRFENFGLLGSGDFAAVYKVRLLNANNNTIQNLDATSTPHAKKASRQGLRLNLCAALTPPDASVPATSEIKSYDCFFAVKKTTRPFRNQSDRLRVMREVEAHNTVKRHTSNKGHPNLLYLYDW
jgi:hypothetical protein